MSLNTLKLKLLRANVMTAYSQLVRNGEFWLARTLLRLLSNERVNLGLGDSDFKVECILEKLGCGIRYSRDGNFARVYLPYEA